MRTRTKQNTKKTTTKTCSTWDFKICRSRASCTHIRDAAAAVKRRDLPHANIVRYCINCTNIGRVTACSFASATSPQQLLLLLLLAQQYAASLRWEEPDRAIPWLRLARVQAEAGATNSSLRNVDQNVVSRKDRFIDITNVALEAIVEARRIHPGLIWESCEGGVNSARGSGCSRRGSHINPGWIRRTSTVSFWVISRKCD